MEGFSYTSNTVKLLKHLDKLKGLQEGRVSPIMVHSIPTHKCNLNCVHCCFKNRKDRSTSISLDDWCQGISNFSSLGTRALEFTGGGDPTLWEPINIAIAYAHDVLAFHIGLITNGIELDRIVVLDKLDWVRVSLNTLDYKDDLNLKTLLSSKTRVSFCYIWNEVSLERFGKIVEFSNKYKIPCRLAPDCIRPLSDIEESVRFIKKELDKYKSNKYVFLSDFNIDVHRSNDKCFIHMIKPCFYVDGYVYECPSAELAVEHDRQISDSMRICRFDTIRDYYLSPDALKYNKRTCSYCKYTQQQRVLEDILTETSFNEFA